MTTIALPSVQSLLIEMRFKDQPLGTGTGFVAVGRKGPVLVTNWHNLAGRHPDTKQPISPTAAIPDEIRIVHNKAKNLGNWIEVVEPLYAAGKPRWAEHPTFSERVDVVALPLTNTSDVELYPHDLLGGQKVRIGPVEAVSVIGFPFGLQAGGSLAVWATGFLASEPEIDFRDLPLMLIDCRTREGQSGSAVIAYRAGGAVAMEDGSTAVMDGPAQRFLGCYSGRINRESDLGLVWKASAVKEIVDAAS
ncbi:MAG: trypsin-like peptidase domain-containing protein [Gemmatimonadaceae bacterium]